MDYAQGFTPDVPSDAPSNKNPAQGKYAPGFTPILGQNTYSPNDSAQALGHSNGLLQNMLSGYQNNVVKPMQDFSTGFAQSAVSHAQNISHAITGPISAMTGIKDTSGFPQEQLQQNGLAAKAGGLAESTAEFFAPGGLEKGLVAKGAEHINQIPEALNIGGKAASAVTNTLKAGLQGTIGAGSFGALTAEQTGDAGKAEGGAVLGGVAGTATGLLETFGPELSTMLQKADFKLSPAKEAKVTKIANNAAQFMTDNKILGSDSTKFGKLTALNSNLESALQTSLPTGLAVPKAQIADEINSNVEALRNTDEAAYNGARSEADKALKLLQERQGDAVDVQTLLSNKRSWGQQAFKLSQKSKADPTVSHEGAYAVEQAYQKSLDGALKDSGQSIKIPNELQGYFGGAKETTLGDFNSVYSKAINAKNLMGIAQFKNDAGLFGRMFGLLAGRMVGHAVAPGILPEIIGMGAGEAFANKAAGGARNLIERGLAHQQVPLEAAKLIQPTLNQ